MIEQTTSNIDSLQGIEYVRKIVKEAVAILSIMSLFFIGCGLIQLTIYYNYFSFPILDYISISEVIIKLFNTLTTCGFSLIFVVIFSNVTPDKIKESWIKNLTLRFIIQLLFLGLTIAFLYSVTIVIKPSSIPSYIANFAGLVSVILYTYLRKREMKTNTKIKLAMFILICAFSAAVLVASIVQPLTASRNFSANKKRHNTYVKFTTGKIIVPLESEYVIGTVQDWVITFNDSNLKSAAYPTSDIEVIIPGDLPSGIEPSNKQHGADGSY